MKKLMTHVVAGYPSMEICEQTVLAMCETGVEYVEIQIPFSDPVADGPTIMGANHKSLEMGTTVADAFALMERLTSQVETPLLFMTYFNILHAQGVEEFCKKASEIGVYGLIVPDMPMDEEEQEGYLAACKKHGLKAIQVISPITPETRLQKIGEVADGFVYCVSRYGTTGVKSDLNPKLQEYLATVRQHVEVPLAVGFGIASPEQADAALQHADIAVMGSKFLKLMHENPGKEVQSVKEFLEKF